MENFIFCEVMSVYFHAAKDGLIRTLVNDVLMHQTSTVKNENFNTYDFHSEYGWNLLLSIPLHLLLHELLSNESSIEFQQGSLSVQ